jgi:hypothetical protein
VNEEGLARLGMSRKKIRIYASQFTTELSENYVYVMLMGCGFVSCKPKQSVHLSK